MVGGLAIVGVRVAVRVWSRVGDGIVVAGTFTTRVTSDVSTRVTSLVTSTVCKMGTDIRVVTNGVQETPINMTRHAVRQGIRNFNLYTPFK
jgi:hypothetical protein